MYSISAPWIDFVTSLARDFDEDALWSLLTQARARFHSPLRFIYFWMFNILAKFAMRHEPKTWTRDRRLVWLTPVKPLVLSNRERWPYAVLSLELAKMKREVNNL